MTSSRHEPTSDAPGNRQQQQRHRSRDEAYLDLHNLRRNVTYVSARTNHDAALLKPNPFLLTQGITALGVPVGMAALVGDSATDIRADKAAGTLSIGYANKPGNRSTLEAAGADAMADTITPAWLREAE